MNSLPPPIGSDAGDPANRIKIKPSRRLGSFILLRIPPDFTRGFDLPPIFRHANGIRAGVGSAAFSCRRSAHAAPTLPLAPKPSPGLKHDHSLRGDRPISPARRDSGFFPAEIDRPARRSPPPRNRPSASTSPPVFPLNLLHFRPSPAGHARGCLSLGSPPAGVGKPRVFPALGL